MNPEGSSPRSIEQFMLSYRRGIHPPIHSAQRVAEACGTALRQAQVLHEIHHSIIDSTRLEGKLKVREIARSNRYERYGEIEADVVDMAGVSIHVFLPHEKKSVRGMINENFKIHWSSVEIIEDRGAEPEHTDVSTEYYWVSLEEERRLWPLRIVEIQVATDAGERPFQTQHELGLFLCKWAVLKGREEDCGDIKPLWELLKVLNLRKPRELRDILQGLDISRAPESDYSRTARGFDPLELTLAMYVTDSVVRSPWGMDRIHDGTNFLERSRKPEQQRYKMKIVRDSFIWLAYLYWWGEGAARMLFSGVDRAMQGRQQRRIVWLDKICTKSFYNDENTVLSEEEDKDLAELWLLFDKHTELPAQYVFNLARLDVKGHSPPSWPHFRRAIFDLVYHCPNCLDRG
ncbi:hypothetical protein BJX76DRAFT_363591 [Aspergillus varians]